MARRRTTSAIACASARSERRNFSRAGVAEKRSCELDHGAARQRGGADRRRRAAAHGDASAPVAAPAAREVTVRPRHRADRGQRLAAEAEGQRCGRDRSPSILEVAWRASASGSSSGGDAVAVVGDADQPLAAVGEGDVDAAGAGVERVLDQLLDRARPGAPPPRRRRCGWRRRRRAGGSAVALSWGRRRSCPKV